METFSALLALCAGNLSAIGEFPAQRPVTRSFDVYFDLRLNKRLSKQPWGWWFVMPSWSLWRHCNDACMCVCVWIVTAHGDVSLSSGGRVLTTTPRIILLGDEWFKVQFRASDLIIKVTDEIWRYINKSSLMLNSYTKVLTLTTDLKHESVA